MIGIEQLSLARFLKINDARVYYSMGRGRVTSIAKDAGAIVKRGGISYIDTVKMNKFLYRGEAEKEGEK